MTEPIQTPDGIRIQISDQHEDDFIHDRISILATNKDDITVVWKLPERLMRRLDVCQIVSEEIQNELADRAFHVKRLGLL